VEIQAPIERVFTFLSSPENMEQIFGEEDPVKGQLISGKPIGIGTTYHFTGTLAGQEMESDAVERGQSRLPFL
jgi:uncharacterized protein YndB with AHSA1/START domain